METPLTSAAPAADPITSLAHKRAVMIDDLTDVLLDGITDADPLEPAHPARQRAGRRTRATARSSDSNRECPPITCTACRVTYIATVALPASVSPEGWICGGCLGDLLIDPRGEERG